MKSVSVHRQRRLAGRNVIDAHAESLAGAVVAHIAAAHASASSCGEVDGRKHVFIVPSNSGLRFSRNAVDALGIVVRCGRPRAGRSRSRSSWWSRLLVAAAWMRCLVRPRPSVGPAASRLRDCRASISRAASSTAFQISPQSAAVSAVERLRESARGPLRAVRRGCGRGDQLPPASGTRPILAKGLDKLRRAWRRARCRRRGRYWPRRRRRRR